MSVTDESSYLITIWSMVFSIISIILSVIEYLLSNHYIQTDSTCVCSTIIAHLEYSIFRSHIINKKFQIQNIVAKISNVNRQQVERMIPIQTSYGVLLTFIIAADATRLKNFDNPVNQIALANVKCV